MSKAISLKLNENIFQEAENIKHYNYLIKRKMLKRQYIKESALAGKHSLKINEEFQEINDEILGL